MKFYQLDGYEMSEEDLRVQAKLGRHPMSLDYIPDCEETDSECFRDGHIERIQIHVLQQLDNAASVEEAFPLKFFGSIPAGYAPKLKYYSKAEFESFTAKDATKFERHLLTHKRAFSTLGEILNKDNTFDLFRSILNLSVFRIRSLTSYGAEDGSRGFSVQLLDKHPAFYAIARSNGVFLDGPEFS